MSTSRRAETVEAILNHRISAIIRTNDQQVAAQAMEAAVAGGFRILEFTLTTPGALELVSAFARKPDVIVGAGTVMEPETARQAVAAGARFLVSPIVDPSVIAEAAGLDVACIPGAFTPTEMELAHRSGADLVKIFPAPPGGVAFIEALRGPLPHLRLFPTAGFTPDNFVDWLSAGCAGVGFVRPLFTAEDLKARDFAAIQRRAAAIVRRLDDWTAKSA
jgi:2-dehydro-3-deoxyphosphogluconate aldolase/(4S)-4-hydroxy-2-oxoglutarate aldolase